MASLESLVLRLEDVTKRLEACASGSSDGGKSSAGGAGITDAMYSKL